jgi:LPXTG-site transpeptidase (sortase) family protein
MDTSECSEKKRKKNRFLLPLCMVLIGLTALIGGFLLTRLPYEEGLERQSQEEDLADLYIQDLIADRQAYLQQSAADAESSSTTSASESSGEDPAQEDSDTQPETSTVEYTMPESSFSDDNWYVRDGVTYTPDYAEGQIACVLEVPSAGIRRGVYTGAIEHDLDVWMVVQANDSYVLGETFYAIYGHNATTQDLSFNRLQTDVKLGDTFTLTNEDGIYTYEVTDLYSLSRQNVNSQIINNWDLPYTKCYLITCGRNEHRYKDYICEGTLVSFMTLDEYIAQFY